MEKQKNIITWRGKAEQGPARLGKYKQGSFTVLLKTGFHIHLATHGLSR